MFQRHTFHTVTDDDWVSFDAVAGDVVTIEAYNVGANAQCLAELFASDGTTLLDQDFTGLEPGGAIIEYIVPANGSFYVRLTNLLGMAGAGTNYDLRIYKPTGPCGTNGGGIHVAVRSSSGLPLSGITVSLTGYGLPKTRTTTTTGTVEFLGLEAATYTVSITDPDYTDVIVPSTVPVACGSSTNVTATLTPVVPPPVLQVTPTQEQSNAPANSKTFTVTNAGGGTLNWTATILPGSEWLSFNGGNTGTNAGSFTVQYGKNDAATARTGWVRLTAPGADGSGVEVSVKQKADTDAPTITLASAAGSTITGAITVTATLSEASTNFAAADVTVANAAVSGFTGSGTSYSFTLTPTYAGNCSVQVNAGVFTDAASNGNTASNVLSKTYAPAQVWVDMAYAGTEHGTQAQPYNTLAEGISAVATAGTLKVKGNTAEHPRITKAMRITANTAPTRIGGTTGLLARVLDTDGDGLPDVWELQHGLNPKDPTGDNGAFGDPDNDGLTNAQEMANGTEPVESDAKAMPTMTTIGIIALLLGFITSAILLYRQAIVRRSAHGAPAVED